MLGNIFISDCMCCCVEADKVLKALRRKPTTATASLVSSPEVVHLKRPTKKQLANGWFKVYSYSYTSKISYLSHLAFC